MRRPTNPIDLKAIARRIDVDNRLPLRYYYRTADSLLRQADVYRSEKNVIDLYAILLRFSSLVSETIPFHRDYHTLLQKEKKIYREKLLAVLDELESLKPEFKRQTDELNKASAGRESYEVVGYVPEMSLLDSLSSYDNSLSVPVAKQLLPGNQISQSAWKQNNDYSQRFSNSVDLDRKFQKMSLTIPAPKQETLSRHSFLGQNGLRGQWQGPTVGTKICYPSQADFTPAEYIDSQTRDKEKTSVYVKDETLGQNASVLEAVLSLDDGKWSHPAEESYPSHSTFERDEEFMPLANIRQPNPPPVLAQVHPEVHSIHPSRVADPRPGPAKASKDRMKGSQAYQNLHIPVKMMDDFLRFAATNTRKNLETCGILAGSLKNRVFHITTLIIPKQESTSDSCQTLNEEEIFEFQDKLSLFPLGWIHTHPTQTCFMSSVDLHTHYSYQIMLPEAIAIVMAPTDSSSPHGIFHLSDPGGVSVIRNCQQRGFHPHEEPSDGSPLYEHCSHVYMNPNTRFEVVDLR